MAEVEEHRLHQQIDELAPHALGEIGVVGHERERAQHVVLLARHPFHQPLVRIHDPWVRHRARSFLPLSRRMSRLAHAAAPTLRAVAVSAYILIQTEVGKAAQVATEVGAIDGVVSAEDVTGPYDVIARAEASSVDELGKMVVSRVQMIDGITRTLTCPVVHL